MRIKFVFFGMFKMLFLLTTCCLLLCSKKLLSQIAEIKFSNITREDGLSSNSVTTIYQDSKGYMWFGTEDGLNRYNGYSFSIYKHKQNSTTGLSNNTINQILEDKKSRIWVATIYGLNLYDYNQDQFSPYLNTITEGGSIKGNVVFSLYEDTKSNIWVGTEAGLKRFNEKDETFTTYVNDLRRKEKEGANIISCMLELNEGKLLIGTDGAGVQQFNVLTRQFTPLDEELKQLDLLKDLRVVSLEKDLDGNLWIGTNGDGAFLFNPKLKTIKNFRYQPNQLGLSSNVVKSILCDHKGNIWIGTENGGVNLLKAGSGTFLHYENDLNRPFSFSQKTASYIFEDNQENIWVAAHRGGINLYSPNASVFKNYTAGAWKGALSYKDVRTFFEHPNGNIWIGTDGGGVNIWDREKNKFKQFRYQANNPNSIGSDAVLDILQDKKSNIWIATWGGGLNLFNKATSTFTRFVHNPQDPSSISSDYIWCLYEGKNGLIYAGTYYEGLNILDLKTKRFSRLLLAPDGKTKLTGNNIYSILEDYNGNLWVGTNDAGLNRFSADRQKFTHYFYDKDKNPTDAVKVLFTDSKNRLWAGKRGLYLYNEKEKTFSLGSSNPYLVNESIQAITQDDKGFLWISTNNGLMQFHPETKYFKRFSKADGLQGLEFASNSVLKTRSGELLFGGSQGFNIFNPQRVTTKNYDYPVYITDLQVFNKSIRPGKDSPLAKYIGKAEKVTLNHGQSVFSFEYAALNFTSPAKTQYAYQLEGFDKRWNYVGSQRKATYTNLDHGTYTFHVKASTIAGIWNSKTATITVIVEPPFWLTWWFKMLAILSVLGSLFTILYYRRKAELKLFHDQKKEELHQLQLQFFINISHEFRTPLTLILGNLEQLLKQDAGSLFMRYYQNIYRNANRLMNLIGELMDFRKTETGVLKLKVMPGNFNLFLQEITQEFKEEAVLHKIEFNVQQGNMYENSWFDRQVMEKILLNLINNSFKYTPNEGTITIALLSSLKDFKPLYNEGSVKVINDYNGKNYIYLSITDTGIGISEKAVEHIFERYYRVSDHHLGSGIGLAFVKSLTLLHKGSIHVYSNHHKGTQILVAVPCDKEDYSAEEVLQLNEENAVQLESVQFKKTETKELPASNLPSPANADEKRQHSILIVDDNPELRTHFKEVLEPYYTIIEAENGQEGILKATNESPELIISDVMMPVMDGVEFCKFIRNDLETSHIPFILLTAKDALEFRIEGMESGADYYFSKPVSTELLMLTIQNLFAQRHKIKERYLKDYQVEVRDLVHSAKDKTFIDKLLKLIEEKLEDPELNVEYVCQTLGTSKTQLYKKIKDITGQSITEFIRTIRLKKAMEIMTHEDVLVTEVMYRVGVLSQSYFTTIFKKEFGMTPSQFQQQLDKKTKSKKSV